jgi:predicted ester cyclase
MANPAFQEGPALARELFSVIDTRDLARTADLLDESFRLYYQGVPDPISKSTLVEMIRSYFDPFPDMRHDLLDVLPSGSYVTVRLVLHATHRGTYEGIPATGRQVAVAAIHVLRTAGGRIVEWWAAEDDLGLLRQIGAVIGPPASPA